MQTQTHNHIAPAEQPLIDQSDRTRFCQETDSNFSVIAPAGVGKTRAITERIVNFIFENADGTTGIDASKLVVVTYTQKAADEMHQRLRQALLRKSIKSNGLATLNKVFFGTIHSFCLHLIKNYGQHIGLPNNFELLNNGQEFWLSFVRTSQRLSSILQTPLAEDVLRYIPLRKVLDLAQELNPNTTKHKNLGRCPDINLHDIFTHQPKKFTTKFNEKRELLAQWKHSLEAGLSPLGLPNFDKGTAEFKNICAESFLPLWKWLGKACLNLAVDIAKNYQIFRLNKNRISYDDMVSLALKLTEHPLASELINELEYRVILDEAQDTDKDQFSILLNITQSKNSEEHTPKPGHFCMVGDPQQCIYSSRADLPTYLKMHETLTENMSTDALTFSVTMRCDRQIVQHVNASFPNILCPNHTSNQVSFVPLNSRPWTLEGNVIKLSVQAAEGKDPIQQEADTIASWLNQQSPKKLGTINWSRGIAILCPRKSWLSPIAKALQSINIPYQIHSNDKTAAHNPAYAWLTALATVMAFPSDSFEITGVLREIFGISDDLLAWHSRFFEKSKEERIAQNHPLTILVPSTQSTEVAEALNILYEIRQKILGLPLRDAIHTLCRSLNLLERLRALPDYSSEELALTLDNLLIKATLAEQDNLTLSDFALNLQSNLDTHLDNVSPNPNAIQLYTCHKSKGLEWDVVIVPFLFRSIPFPTETYPQLGTSSANTPPSIAVSSHPEKTEIDFAKAHQRRSELQRLLYVTATRARNTLIWIDDEALFPKPQNSLAEVLRVTFNAANRKSWEALSPEILNPQELSQPVENQTSNITTNESKQNIDFQEALTQSRNHLCLKTPSRESHHYGLTQGTSQELAIPYGNWWHEIMQSLPWHTTDESFKEKAHHALSICPSPARGQRELATFFESELFTTLTEEHSTIITETPFVFKENNNVFEGAIDFVLFNKITQSYTILDWKTDLVSENETQLLIKKYSPQLRIYQKALTSTHVLVSKTLIYSTSLGMCLLIN